MLTQTVGAQEGRRAEQAIRAALSDQDERAAPGS